MAEVDVDRLEKAFNSAYDAGDMDTVNQLAPILANYHGMTKRQPQEDSTAVPPVDSEPTNLVGRSVVSGAVEGSLVFPGLVAGAKAGAATGALAGGWGAIPGGLLGAVGGAWAGLKAGDVINEELAERTGISISDAEIASLSEDDYEKYYLASMSGSVISGGGLTSLTAKTGVRFAPKVVGKAFKSKAASKASSFGAKAVNATGTKLNDILSFAAKHPVKYAALESSVIPSTYATGRIFEEFSGDRDGGARLAGEMVGAVFNPLSLVGAGLKKSWNKGISLYNQMISKSGTQNMGKSEMARLWRSAGKEPDLDTTFGAIKYMRQDKLAKENVGLLSGDPRLMAISKQLEKHNPTFAQNNKKILEETTNAIEKSVIGLKASGDPEDLLAAADLEFEYVKRMIDADIATAEKLAIEAAQDIMDEGIITDPKKYMKLSKQTTDMFKESLGRAREVEKSYWDKVKHVEIGADGFSNVFNAFESVKNRLAPEQVKEVISSSVSEFFDNVKSEATGVVDTGLVDAAGNAITKSSDNVITTKRLQDFRSWMLNKASKAIEAGDKAKSSAYSSLADAALTDLEASNLTGEAHQLARQVSYQLNETFSRSFLGTRAAAGRFGLKKSPELLLQEVFATGDEAAEIMLSDIDEVSRFMDSYASPEMVEETDRVMGVIRGAQENMFKYNGAKFVDVEQIVGADGLPTQKVNIDSKGLKKFIKDNPILLNRFPEVKKSLEDVLTKESARLEVIAQAKNTTANFEKKSAFASVLNKEPVAEVRKALKSDAPFKKLDKMVEVVNKSSQGNKNAAMLGLRSAIIESILTSSVNSSGELNVKAFKSQLAAPIGKDGSTLVDYLKSKKVFTDDDVSRITYLMDRADTIMQYKNPMEAIANIDTESDYLIQQLVSGIGATKGPEIARGIFGDSVGGHSLLLASRSSGMAAKLFQSIPRNKSTDFMINLLEDPDMFMDVMATEMKKGKVSPLTEGLRYRRGYSAIYRGGYTSEPGTDEKESSLSPLYSKDQP